MMRVLICADEDWTDAAIVKRELAGLPRDVLIVFPEDDDNEGEYVAWLEAEEMGLNVGSYHVWGTDSDPDLVLAFLPVPFVENGDVDQANRRGLPVEIVTTVFKERYLSIKIPLGTGSAEAIQARISEPLRRGGREHFAAGAAMIGRGLELLLMADRVGRSSVKANKEDSR